MTTTIETTTTTEHPTIVEQIADKILARSKKLVDKYEEETNEFSRMHIMGEGEYEQMKEGLDNRELLIDALPHYAQLYEAYIKYELVYASKNIRDLDIRIGMSFKYLHCERVGIGWKMIWAWGSEMRELYEYYKSGEHQHQKGERVCPRCGGKLIEREGRYGKFLGCENYPKCRYTENIG